MKSKKSASTPLQKVALEVSCHYNQSGLESRRLNQQSFILFPVCGRYTLTKPLEEIESYFGPLVIKLEHQRRFNIAPSQEAPVVVILEGRKHLVRMRWGLIPSWAKDKTIGLINARAETVHEKPSFRHSFRSKRCLIPCDGFFEWGEIEKEKIPHYIRLKTSGLFALAGIWSQWEQKDLRRITYSIITTEANSLLKSLHDRMPVILPPENYDAWLDPSCDSETLRSLLATFPSENLETYKISKAVNSPKNDREEILQRL